MFTQAEKNEIIARIDKQKKKYGFVYCPFFSGTCSPHPYEKCKNIFPKIIKTPFETDCPCDVYGSKYVKQKFWKAME